MQMVWMSLIVYNACKIQKLLPIPFIPIISAFNRTFLMIHKNQNIDILPLLFMPFTGEKKLSHNFCFIYLEIANFTDFFWVKHTLMQHSVSKKQFRLLFENHRFFVILRIWDSLQKYNLTLLFFFHYLVVFNQTCVMITETNSVSIPLVPLRQNPLPHQKMFWMDW